MRNLALAIAVFVLSCVLSLTPVPGLRVETGVPVREIGTGDSEVTSARRQRLCRVHPRPSSKQTEPILLCSSDGSLPATATITLPRSGHLAQFVARPDWQTEPEVSLDFRRFTGLIKARSKTEIIATVLQTRGNQLTTMLVSGRLA